jgi:flagellar basal body-associated protein FliL
MDKKFFNDILYVKEKLKKNLQNNFNKTLEGGGRVKKITFKEFTVQ